MVSILLKSLTLNTFGFQIVEIHFLDSIGSREISILMSFIHTAYPVGTMLKSWSAFFIPWPSVLAHSYPLIILTFQSCWFQKMLWIDLLSSKLVFLYKLWSWRRMSYTYFIFLHTIVVIVDSVIVTTNINLLCFKTIRLREAEWEIVVNFQTWFENIRDYKCLSQRLVYLKIQSLFWKPFVLYLIMRLLSNSFAHTCFIYIYFSLLVRRSIGESCLRSWSEIGKDISIKTFWSRALELVIGFVYRCFLLNKILNKSSGLVYFLSKLY